MYYKSGKEKLFYLGVMEGFKEEKTLEVALEG